ncbi:MAG: ankyrin repeat domain-containing protein [Legionellales bacterium]|nr:ankyrin repeat domain-containing protein [Legionellales bacterium]
MFNPDDREKQIDKYIKEQAERDSSNAALAKSNFDSRVGFADAVDTEIKPCIQELAIADRKGTTFYFGSNWISSNSHVVASLEELAIASLAGEGLAGDVFSGFFRPKVLGDYPDIMVANISDNSDNKSIPILWFSLSECHAESLTFYIDIYDRENPVKLLNKIEDVKSGLLAYRQVDGNIPEPGTSGSPIVEARLVIPEKDSPPQWVFALQGVLFAYQKETINVYAVELGQDLDQIRQMLFKKQEQERAQESGEAVITLGDNPACFWSDVAKAKEIYDKELVCYNEGVGASIIDLPDNLVPLADSTIVPLKCSYRLIGSERDISPSRKNLRPGSGGYIKEHSKYNDKLKKMMHPAITLSELRADRDELYTKIEAIKSVTLPSCSDSRESSDVETTINLRVDHIGSIDSGYFIFSLQDNLEDSNSVAIKSNGKSISSTFAMAKIYTNIPKIDSSLLIAMLRRSESISKCVKYWDVKGESLSSKYKNDKNSEFEYDGAKSVAAVTLYNDRKGNRGLYNAVIRGDLVAIESLKDKANFSVVDKEGNNLLHLAIKNCPPTVVLPVVCSLLGCGVDINANNEKGKGVSSLILAIKKGYADVATALIDFGANVDVVDRNQKTAFALASTCAEQSKGFDVVVKKIVAKIEESIKNIENRNSVGPKR